MTLADVMPPYRDDAPRLSDRTPPQDMDAEQCVLGAMLMSKDAIADVVQVRRGSDFYRPAHEQVYNAITDLYGRGEPADAVTGGAAEAATGGRPARTVAAMVATMDMERRADMQDPLGRGSKRRQAERRQA